MGGAKSLQIAAKTGADVNLVRVVEVLHRREKTVLRENPHR
jgi:hypothetical protein